MPSKKVHSNDNGSLVYVVVELDNTHEVPVNWASEDTSTGYARILLNKDTNEIYRMEMIVDGIFVSDADNTLEDNPIQPFHFHNLPQGGPNFVVQQLFDVDAGTGDITTASLVNTDTGFSFTIDEPYALRPPVNNPGLGADFTIQEILDGNGYLGLHTNNRPIPATPIAGDLTVLGDGTIDGKLLWLGDENDVSHGGRKNDLLSLGGGNDKAWGHAGNDIMDGGAGNDRMAGQRGDDVMWGGDDNDRLIGGKGDDDLSGNRGADNLNGGRGADALNGGDGLDLLIGGFGNDVLTGGADIDVFRFGMRSGSDTITDFVVGEDSIAFVGGQRVVGAELADLDGDGDVDDTALDLFRGEIAVLNVDLTGEFGLLA